MRRMVPWIIGAGIFLVILAGWLVLLPRQLQHVAGLNNAGLSGLFKSFHATAEQTGTELIDIQHRFEANLKTLDATIAAQAAVEAQAATVDALKEKVAEAAEKEKEKK